MAYFHPHYFLRTQMDEKTVIGFEFDQILILKIQFFRISWNSQQAVDLISIFEQWSLESILLF